MTGWGAHAHPWATQGEPGAARVFVPPTPLVLPPPSPFPPSSCPDLFRAPTGAATAPARPTCAPRGCMGGRNKSGHDGVGAHAHPWATQGEPGAARVFVPPTPLVLPPPSPSPPSSCPDLFRAPTGAATAPARPTCAPRGCMGGRNKSGHDVVGGACAPMGDAGRAGCGPRLRPAYPPRPAPSLAIPPLVMPGLVPGSH